MASLSQEQINFQIQTQQISKAQHDYEVVRDVSEALMGLAEHYYLQEYPFVGDLFRQMSHAIRMTGYGGFEFVDMPTPFSDAIEEMFFWKEQ